jgi:peptidoglycan/LPS O-acetylase OafA/YrhL
MNLENPLAYFVLMAVVLGVARLPAFARLDEPAGVAGRVSSIDGLRGFLALGVFVFHMVLMRRYLVEGIWESPQGHFYAVIGPVGVSVFFMLTGYLFWTRLLRTRGRPGWVRLYIGRLFRIGPMYLAVVLAMLAIVAARSDFALREPAAAVASQALQWLALGLIDTQPDVNGEVARHVLAGVTWTLWYEWVFYGSLLAWAVVARWRRHLAAVLLALLACLAAKRFGHVDALGFGALFTIGMAVGSWRHARPASRLSEPVWSAIGGLCLVGACAAPGTGYGSVAGLLLGGFFLAVCSGATLFGLLRTRAAQRLGTVSYSLYLMQGLVLAVMLAIGPVARFALSSPLAWWVMGTASAVLLVLAATAGYLWIERPGIALGRRVVERGWRFQPSSATAASSDTP